jgi:hypothetical protein
MKGFLGSTQDHADHFSDRPFAPLVAPDGMANEVRCSKNATMNFVVGEPVRLM